MPISSIFHVHVGQCVTLADQTLAKEGSVKSFINKRAIQNHSQLTEKNEFDTQRSNTEQKGKTEIKVINRKHGNLLTDMEKGLVCTAKGDNTLQKEDTNRQVIYTGEHDWKSGEAER